MNFVTGITLAPRDNPTIEQSLDSWFEQVHYGEVHIFAEPLSPDINKENVTIHKNEKVLGNMGNFHHCLTSLIAMGEKYVITLQDDYKWNENTRKAIEHFIQSDNDGVGVLTTRPGMEKRLYKRGWNNVDLGRGAFGAAYIMKTTTAKRIVNSKLYQSHLKYYYPNKTDDACVGEVCLQDGIPMWYFNPGPSTHFGASSLGHKDFALDQQVSKTAKKICVGIATIKERQNSFVNTMKSLALQADEIFVGLNYNREEANDEVKEVLARKNVTVLQGDGFARSKFFGLEHAEGYYLTCDDDILYPADYTKKIVQELQKRDNRVVVGYHGVILKDGGNDWLSNRITHSFTYGLEKPVDVHYVGTGCMGFYTGLIDYIPHFGYDNFEDLGFAEFIQKKGIPAVCLPREKGWLKEQPSNVSIYSKAKEKKKLLNNIAQDCNLRIIPSETKKFGAWNITGEEMAEMSSMLSYSFDDNTNVYFFDAVIPMHKYIPKINSYHGGTDKIRELGKLLKVYQNEKCNFSYLEKGRVGIVGDYTDYVFAIWNNGQYQILQQTLEWLINNVDTCNIHLFIPGEMNCSLIEEILRMHNIECNRMNGWNVTYYLIKK